MNYECIDVSGWHKFVEPTKGSREKQWILKPLEGKSHEVEFYLFKESNKRYPAEFWAEIVASAVGELVGVTVPETFCAKLDDKYAALVKFFLKIEWDPNQKRFGQLDTLFHGGDLIMGLDPAFDRKVGDKHNIFLVERIFSEMVPNNLFDQFLKILIFDTLIGNTDRHQDNWGFIQDNKTNEMNLAPAFDNSTSLGSELIEQKIAGYLDRGKVQLRQYIKKGKAHIRWSDNGTDLVRLNHFDLLAKIAADAAKRKIIVEHVQAMTLFTDNQIENILSDYGKIEVDIPIYRLSDTRRELMKSIICLRRDLLKEQFN